MSAIEILKVAIPAAIALVGTIVTVIVGYRQWKRKQELERYGDFHTGKQSAYRKLWEKLEEIHIKLRVDTVSPEEFDMLIRNVNSYILRQSLYLDDQDKLLANEYLDAVYKLKGLVSQSQDKEVKRNWGVTRRLTLPSESPMLNRRLFSPPVREVQELKLVEDEVERIRKTLIRKFRRVVGGRFR